MNFNKDLQFGDNPEDSDDLLLSFCTAFKDELNFTAKSAEAEELVVNSELIDRLSAIEKLLEGEIVDETEKISLQIEKEVLKKNLEASKRL